MEITDLSILCKWETLKIRQCIKYIFAALYSHTVSHRSENTPHIFVNILLYLFM